MKELFNEKILHHFQPSGLNNVFCYQNLAFQDYCTAVKKMLLTVREKCSIDINQQYIELNAPFEWKPSHPNGEGVLLIHGLFDSPFIMRDLGKHFVEKGFLVRSILLPGHATIPADLLTTSYKEWIKAIEYGIKSFKDQVSNLHLAGFSTGAALAIHHTCYNPNDLPAIKSLLLFSPAIAINAKNTFLVKIYRTFRWFLHHKKWVVRSEAPDYTKYTSFPINSAFHVQRIIIENNTALKKQKVSLPVFMALSTTDETINPARALTFFTNTTHHKNRCILYTNENIHPIDQRIMLHTSKKVDEHILDMSHVSLLTSPENRHYGINGDHQEPIQQPKKNHTDKTIYLGASTAENEKNYCIRRLTFNPFFDEMLVSIDDFLQSIK